MPLTNEVLLLHFSTPPAPGWLDTLRSRFPGLEVRLELAGTTESGDVQTADSLPPEVLEGVTMMCLFPPPSADIMPNVRFVQLPSAGSDRWANHPKFLDPNVQFCSGVGAHPPQIAEWVIGAWINHTHHLPAYADQQREEAWKTIPSAVVSDSVGRRVGILGYGAIGRQCARLLSALGMEVLAYTQRPRPTAESRRLRDGYTVPGLGDTEGVIPSGWHHGDIDDFLSRGLDLVIVSMPLTRSTRQLIGRKQFEILRTSSSRDRKKPFVVNIARGPIVDTGALIEALETGAIAGAALDVTDPEPLPEGHPLWKAPNVFISPHVSWHSTSVFSRTCAILMENLRRLDEGESLINVIDRSTG